MTFSAKWLHSAADELGHLRPKLRVMQTMGNVLPQFCFNRLRTEIWRKAGFRIGAYTLIMGDLVLSGDGDWSTLLEVGTHTLITGPLRINLGGKVRIGSGINIGHDCMLLTVNHQIGLCSRRAGTSTHGDVVIGDGAWLASRVTVLPGVCIGAGAVVAAGAVVTTDVEPHTMVGGVPARLLRRLPTPAQEERASRSEAPNRAGATTASTRTAAPYEEAPSVDD